MARCARIEIEALGGHTIKSRRGKVRELASKQARPTNGEYA